MTVSQLGFLGTFVFGTLFGVVLTVAIFRSSVAVVEKRLDHIEEAARAHTIAVDRVFAEMRQRSEWLERKLADVMLKSGAARRLSDPPEGGL